MDEEDVMEKAEKSGEDTMTVSHSLLGAAKIIFFQIQESDIGSWEEVIEKVIVHQ